MDPIRSAANPSVRLLRALLQDARARREAGQAVVEGPHLCGEALSAGAALEFWASPQALEGREARKLLALAAQAGLKPRLLSAGLLKRLSELPAPQGYLARVRAEAPAWPETPTLCLALDGLQDPGNVGTLLRSAWAANAPVLLGPACADPWSPKVLRASAGAVFHVPFRRVPELATELAAWARKGMRVLACEPHAARTLWDVDLRRSVCLVLGAEGSGLSPALRAVCSDSLRISHPGGAESLNVAVSGSIVLFEALRQRR
jgi:TrmH family RNA methyltransferase